MKKGARISQKKDVTILEASDEVLEPLVELGGVLEQLGSP